MHTHADAPGHQEGHDHAPERYADRAHPEYVVLEIGGDFGALIIHADSDLHGVEVEISPDGNDAARSHKEVLERRIAGRPAYTAVFDRLAEGRYTLWMHGKATARGVEIAGGSVAELQLDAPSNGRV